MGRLHGRKRTEKRRRRRGRATNAKVGANALNGTRGGGTRRLTSSAKQSSRALSSASRGAASGSTFQHGTDSTAGIYLCGRDATHRTFWEQQHEVRAKVRAGVWPLDPRYSDPAWAGVQSDEAAAVIEDSLKPFVSAARRAVVDRLLKPELVSLVIVLGSYLSGQSLNLLGQSLNLIGDVQSLNLFAFFMVKNAGCFT